MKPTPNKDLEQSVLDSPSSSSVGEIRYATFEHNYLVSCEDSDDDCELTETESKPNLVFD